MTSYTSRAPGDGDATGESADIAHLIAALERSLTQARVQIVSQTCIKMQRVSGR